MKFYAIFWGKSTFGSIFKFWQSNPKIEIGTNFQNLFNNCIISEFIFTIPNFRKMSSYKSLKRSANNLSENESKLKNNKEGEEFNFSKVLPKIHELYRIISNKSDLNSPIMTSLRRICDEIPQVVVWGVQSYGKSSLLNRMFDVNLKVSQGLTTLCPTQLKFSPIYEERVFIDQNGKSLGEYKTYDEAARSVSNMTGGKLSDNLSIVCEKYHKDSIIITDLPGCTVDGNSDFFTQIRDRYLCRSKTVILYVVRGDTDTASDVSKQYLGGINNNIIPVLTHTDGWVTDKSKQDYLHQYRNFKIIGLTHNKENEVDTLNSMNPVLNNVRLLIGSMDLNRYVCEILKDKTKEAIPQIKETLNLVINALNSELCRIGSSKPNMRDIMVEFRRKMPDDIRKEILESNTQLTIKINEIKELISQDILVVTCQSIIPDCKELTEAMKIGSRRKLAGSEGWDDIIKLYSGKIVESIEPVIIKYIQVYAETFNNCLQNIITREYKPSTRCMQNKLVPVLAEIIKSNKNKILNQVIKYLKGFSDFQYNNDKTYSENYQKDLIKDYIEIALNMVLGFTDIRRESENALRNIDQTTLIILNNSHNDPYTFKANCAIKQLNAFWKSKSIEIHNNITQDLVRKFDEKVENDIITEIDKVTEDDFAEPDSIEKERKDLNNISELCTQIRKCI